MNKLKTIFNLVTLVFWTIAIPTIVGIYLWTSKREELYTIGVLMLVGTFGIWLLYYGRLIVNGIAAARGERK